MKKLTALLFIAAMAALSACASKDPVADGKAILTEINGIINETTTKLSSASNEKDVQSAFLSLTANSAKIAVKMKTYEFKNSGKNLFTDGDFKSERATLAEAVMRFAGASQDAMKKYPNAVPTEDVAKAMSTLTGEKTGL